MPTVKELIARYELGVATQVERQSIAGTEGQPGKVAEHIKEWETVGRASSLNHHGSEIQCSAKELSPEPSSARNISPEPSRSKNLSSEPSSSAKELLPEFPEVKTGGTISSATKMANEWFEYLGLSREDIEYACRGYVVHIFVNKFGGSLRSVRVHFDFDRGLMVFTRPNGTRSTLAIGHIANVIHPRKTEKFLKRLKGDRAVSKESVETVSGTWHLLLDFRNTAAGKKDGPACSFLFCFDNDYDSQLFEACAAQYLQSISSPPFKIKK